MSWPPTSLVTQYGHSTDATARPGRLAVIQNQIMDDVDLIVDQLGVNPSAILNATISDLPPASPTEGQLWYDSMEFIFDPDQNAWPTITEVPITSATNTFSRTIVTPSTDVHTVSTSRVARISCTAGAEGNDRRLLVFADVPPLDDIEMTALLYSRTAPQQGFGLRLNNSGNTTTQSFYAVWNDKAFNLQTWWNAGRWKGTNANFLLTFGSGAPSSYLESLENVAPLVSMVRSAGVVTAVGIAPVRFQVNDVIVVAASTTASFSGQFTVTGVTNNTITWAQAGANETAAFFGVAGYAALIGPVRALYPQKLKVRLVGRRLRLKAWLARDPEPSWSNPRAVLNWQDSANDGPSGTGQVGILSNHLTSGGFVDWGPITITRAEPGLKVYRSGAWKALDRQTT